MSYRGFDYVIGYQLARKLPGLIPPLGGKSPTRTTKTIVCVEHTESCSDLGSDTSLQALSTPSAVSKLRKKKSVHFEDSTEPSSCDESDELGNSSKVCSSLGERKSILQKDGNKESIANDDYSSTLQCCSTCGRESKGGKYPKQNNQSKQKSNIQGQNTDKDQTQNRTQSQDHPQATCLRKSFGPLQPATRTQQLANRVKLHKMVQHILQPSRADVVRREDVVEQPSDPRPNAFFDQRSGLLRVYHGPTYGNPYGSLYGNLGNSSSIGTFPPAYGGGGGGYGYPQPYTNSPMHQFQQMSYQQFPHHCHCQQCNQQQGNHYQDNFQQNNCQSTPRITSDKNPYDSKHSSPANNNKPGGVQRGSGDSRSIPGAWVPDSKHDDGEAGGSDNNSSAWAANTGSLGRGENSWGNDTSKKNDDLKSNTGGDFWNNHSGDKGGSSCWNNHDSTDAWQSTSKNDSNSNHISSNGEGDKTNDKCVNGANASNWGNDNSNEYSGNKDTGNSWGDNNAFRDNWNSDSQKDPGNEDSGSSWGKTGSEKPASGDGSTCIGSAAWGDLSNNNPPGQTNWGGNSGGNNTGGAWGTETALSGGSWANGGTGPTNNNVNW